MSSSATPAIETSQADLLPRVLPAHRISNDQEALEIAQALAAEFRVGASERDRQRRLPWDEIEKFSASGLGGITVPREFGGAQVSYRTLAEVFRVLCAADPALGQIPQNHFGILGVVAQSANAAQKARIYAAVLNGERIGNAGPERGTKNILEMKARLIETPNGYRLNGKKFYSTGALFAHWVPTKALDEQGRVVLAFVRRGALGLKIVDDWSGFGQRTTASGTVLLDNVAVPAEDVLPIYASGQLPSLQGPVSQLIQAAIDAGIADAAVTDAIAFIRTRSRPWADSGVERASDDPYIIRDIGDLKIRLHAANALLAKAGTALDQIATAVVDADASARASIAVAKAKVLTTEIALHASEKLFELAGSAATLAEHNLDRHWRNARTHTLHDPVRWKLHAIGNYVLNGIAPARHSWN
ncbi:sulfur acquisition oxidoreductase, SfnB family [Collimonas arenae]|uniref:Sulfur acquisition oxidoreductase, SfnB family n=1 Tax=Collimonas arenae TaxID=279058 RepID=A0A127QH94_9BURK|nr:SfnB family sulfur acquisition oxidoreductase [Collimonas arenae]AMO99530.1 sulfur acquisition oxidoreductase, SfnB family [Collimonas arenae]AMP09429.1 sulfur acquisition oxidoreductase, SfnB family [Collimonas arenae]